MADSALHSLTAKTSLATTDEFYLVQSPYGSGDDRRVALSDFKTSIFASPTLVTPTLGVATATSINKVALTAPATGSTLTIADGKTLTANNSITLAGTDSTTMTFPSTSATIARTDAANTFTGAQTISGGTVNGTVLDISQTWGSTGTYTGIKYNVTDSGPANAASLLLDLQVGGSSKFSINKAGTVTFSNGAILSNASGLDLATNAVARSGAIQFGPSSDTILSRQTGGVLKVAHATIAGAILYDPKTIANLTASPATGMVSAVTDANAPAIGSTVASGGSAKALVWYNGANWTVIGV